MKKVNRSILQSIFKDLKKGFKRVYWFIYTFFKYHFLTIKFNISRKEVYTNKISLLLPSRERSKKGKRSG